MKSKNLFLNVVKCRVRDRECHLLFLFVEKCVGFRWYILANCRKLKY